MGRWMKTLWIVLPCALAAAACGSATNESSDGRQIAAVDPTSAAAPDSTEVMTATTDRSSSSVAPAATIPLATETTAAPTGSSTNCPVGQRLDDPDGDLFGECVIDEVAINTWTAQAAAEAAGLPRGTPCLYPPTLVVGKTAIVNCNVVNMDTSEGSWSFVLASDSSVASAATYTQTKAPTPPSTQAPATIPQVRPALATSDPRFGTCKEAKAHGYGPYRSDDPEYSWYQDRDHDGIVCE